MRRFRYLILLSVTLINLCCTLPSEAKRARKDPFTYTKSDGTQLTLVTKGDEHSHATYTTDGLMVIHTDSLGYVYATYDSDGTPVPSSVIPSDPDARGPEEKQFANKLKEVTLSFPSQINSNHRVRTTGANIQTRSGSGQRYGRFSTNFPVFGEQKVIVILVEYQDVAFDLGEEAHSYFLKMLNQEGFSDYGATGSARDWFIQNSRGQFMPEFDVYGPVTLPNDRAYYGGNDRYGNDKHPEEMVIDACCILDATVDFSQYDRDNDGYIDNVYVFYAGEGESDRGGADTVWPHSWEIYTGAGKKIMLDGKILNYYACSNETDHYAKRPDGIGTFVHEFSHVLGLPDLYSTVESTAFTPDEYSVLDYGPYNNDGRTPPNYSAFELNALGWETPDAFGASGTYTLPPLTDTEKKSFIIPTDKETEFFLVENRQKLGNDLYLPGHGMLVWHIDYDKYIWNDNTVNNRAYHQHVDIVEADNIASFTTMDGDTFPGASGITEFSFTTTPSLCSWSGKDMGLSFSDIREDGDEVTFKLANTNTPSTVTGVTVEPGLRVEGDEIISDYEVTVHSINGMTVGKGKRIKLPAKGIYVVHSNSFTKKIVY